MYWTKCVDAEPPQNRKIFIKHGDKIHCGIFQVKRDGKFYFHLDSGSAQQPRVGTHWCMVPNSLLYPPSPDVVATEQDAQTKTAQLEKAQAESSTNSAPKASIVPPVVIPLPGEDPHNRYNLPEDIKEGTEAFQLMLYDNWSVEDVRKARREGTLGYE